MTNDSLVVLITGATGPAGRAASRRFAADGACLALNGSNPGRLAALVSDLALPSHRVLPVPGDLRVQATAGEVVAATEATFGRVDVLLHLVGGWTGGTAVADLDHREVRRMLDQHLWTTLHMIQAVVPGMRERGFGRVIAVSSPFAATPGPKGASYAMAKAAEEVLVKSLAREVAADGITANIVVVRAIEVAPSSGTVDLPPGTPAPPGKLTSTTPEELAETLAWLASPAAGSVTGERISLAGRG